MTQPVSIQQHKHVFEKKPEDSFITDHPQRLYIWLKPTAVTSISVSAIISTTIIKDYTIDDIEVEEAYYDNYYSGTAFPTNVKQKYSLIILVMD